MYKKVNNYTVKRKKIYRCIILNLSEKHNQKTKILEIKNVFNYDN